MFRYSGGKWKPIHDSMDLANHTLVYGDMVDEITYFDNKQMMTTGFHIIDGLILGGKDIRNLSFSERYVVFFADHLFFEIVWIWIGWTCTTFVVFLLVEL